jgi:MFS transporter, DHA1 family, inner membrane transport protein
MVYPFLPAFGRGLGVDLPALSRAMAVRSASGFFGPFLASIADSRGRKKAMLLGLFLFILGVFLAGVIPTFPAFACALVLTSVGYFTFNPAMQAYLGDQVPYEQRGRAMALPELGWSLSFIVGVPLMGLLIGRFGWQAPFLVLTCLGVASFGYMACRLPGDTIFRERWTGIFKVIRLALISAPAIAGIILGVSSAAANEMVTLIFGVWLEDSFGFKIAALGITASLIGLAELTGELMTAGFVDRVGKTRATAAGLVLNCLAAASLAFSGGRWPLALTGIFFFYLGYEISVVSSLPILSEIMPHARATIFAIIVAAYALGRTLGDILSPWLYRAGGQSAHLSGMQFIAAGVILFNFIALFALPVLARGVPERAVDQNPLS